MKIKMDDRLYDTLKWVAQVLLPALGTLYFALSEIWGLAYGIEVVGTITAFDLFLGTLLGLQSRSYYRSEDPYDGLMEVEYTEEGKKLYTMHLKDEDLDHLDQKDHVAFKVNRPPEH